MQPKKWKIYISIFYKIIHKYIRNLKYELYKSDKIFFYHFYIILSFTFIQLILYKSEKR